MTQPAQEIYKLDEIKRKAILSCGSEYLTVEFEKEHPSAGAWDPKNIKLQPEVCSEIELPNVALAVNTVTSSVNTVASAIASVHSGSLSGWIEIYDTFTQEDLLNSEENEVQNLISLFRRSLTISYFEILTNRLYALYGDSKEEDPFSSGINLGSLRNFYNFLQLHANLKYPIITLTSDNNIYASWKGEQNRVFSLHFLPTGDVNFVIFKPNDRHPEKQVRISGTATTDVLMETVTPQGLFNWIVQ